MTARLTIGFMPLVDAALPILAHEHGFAEAEGLALDFVRDLSWATVRDRLLYGHSDVAHMLAPLAIAASLGTERPARAMAVPFVLGLNGNAITFSTALAESVGLGPGLGSPAEVGEALRPIARARLEAGRQLRFGAVHRHSSHNYIMRYWLAACGIAPERDIAIVTVAPPFAADALAGGDVDAICVGEPWNSIAVERGVGRIALVTAQIWRRGVEKVLALPADRLDALRPAVERLIRAMRRAGAHFVEPANWDANAAILARDNYLGGDPQLIRRAISDRLLISRGGEPVHFPDFMFQHREVANFPWTSQARWLHAQMLRWENRPFDKAESDRAAAVFRPDVYRSALADTADALPGATSKVEGAVGAELAIGSTQGRIVLQGDAFFDSRTFDPESVDEYLEGLPKV